MKTERLYYDYSSALPFDAEILEIRPAAGGGNGANTGDSAACVLLDKTIFYPEGGGQSADSGTINGAALFDVQEKNGEILHFVSSGAAALKPGKAALVLDSRRRRDITALHTGQHLLSGIILRITGKPTVSMHLGDESCTIDVDTAGMSGEVLTAVEEAVADAIEQNHPVLIHLCPPEDISSFPLRKVPPKGEELVRVVEIEGNDFSPCCGTHLKSTAEIGMLRILGAEKYKGMTRVSFNAGRRLLRDCRLLAQNAGIVSRALKVPLGETGRGVLEFLEKSALIERRLKTLEEGAARARARALLDKAAPRCGGEGAPPVLIETYADAGIDEALAAGRIAQKETGAVLVLAAERDLKFAAFCAEKGFDLRSLIREALDASGGRGGGSASFFQGSFGTREALDTFLRLLREKCSAQGRLAT